MVTGTHPWRIERSNRILKILKDFYTEGATNTELAYALHLPWQTVLYDLQLLQEQGKVTSTPTIRNKVWSLNANKTAVRTPNQGARVLTPQPTNHHAQGRGSAGHSLHHR